MCDGVKVSGEGCGCDEHVGWVWCVERGGVLLCGWGWSDCWVGME